MKTYLKNKSGESGRSGPLTRGQRREVKRRERLLLKVATLKAAGLSETKAAKIARISTLSLWRWRKSGIIPRFNLCGRKPTTARFTISENLIGKVQRLMAAGQPQERAWRSLAEDPACPPDLAEFLKTAPKIPPCFFEVSRLKRVRATILVGKTFSHIPQPLNAP